MKCDSATQGHKFSKSSKGGGRKNLGSPVSIERRVVFNDKEWCLVTYRKGGNKDAETELAWQSKEELLDSLSAEQSISLYRNPVTVSLGGEESRALQERVNAVNDELEQVQEDFRRYRVRSEIMRKQKETELAKVMEASMDFQQRRITSEGAQQELVKARSQIERLKKQCATLLQQQDQAQQKKVSGDRRKKKGSGSEARDLKDLKSYDDSQPVNGEDAAEALRLLRHEYREYRKRALEVVEQKDKELQQAEDWMRKMTKHKQESSVLASSSRRSASGNSNSRDSGGSSGGAIGTMVMPDDATTEYLKNIVLKYMATDEVQVKEHMEAAIATVLRFSAAEMDFIHNKRNGNSWGRYFGIA